MYDDLTNEYTIYEPYTQQDWIEEPIYFFFNTDADEYQEVTELTPEMTEVFIFNEDTLNFQTVTDVPELFFYDTVSESLTYISQPSPYLTEYYTFEESTNTFVPFSEPIVFDNVYTYDVGTDTYVKVSEATAEI